MRAGEGVGSRFCWRIARSKGRSHPHGAAWQTRLVSIPVVTVTALSLLATPAVSPAHAAVLPEAPCSVGARPVGGGVHHGLMLGGDGTVWASGQNWDGQLGDGTTADSAVPVETVGLTDVVGVVGGAEGSVAITAAGEVYVWGRHRLGGSSGTATEPVHVDGLPAVRDAAVGGSHFMVLTADGTVWTWGANWYGQLGDGTSEARTVPTQVPGLTDVVSIAAGMNHSLAVRSDGSVWAWGMNWHGQLGNGQLGWGVEEWSPVKTSTLSSALEVAAGAYHSLALLADGTARAWGLNDQGQLGDGTIDQHTTPNPVPGISGLKMLAASSMGGHSLGLQQDGRLFAWGRNAEGQLGLGSTSSRVLSPTQIGLQDVGAVAAAGNTSRAATGAGSHYAWGQNTYGQLGDGTTTLRAAPRLISSVAYPAPSAPTTLDAFGGERLAYLTWEQPAGAVTTQHVASAAPGAVEFDPVAFPPGGSEGVISPLQVGVAYTFEVVAQNCVGTSDASPSSQPAVPTEVQVGGSDAARESLRLTDRMQVEVNTFNGNVQLSARDLELAGVNGLDVEVGRTYNARSDRISAFGRGWTSTLAPDVSLRLSDAGVAMVHSADGAVTAFAPDGDGGWVTPPGTHADLHTRTEGGWELTERISGMLWTFDATGALTQLTDRNGNGIVYERDGQGRLGRLIDTRDRPIDITYSGDRIVRIEDVSGRRWSYGYTGDLLTRVTDPTGGETTLTYTSDKLTQITTPAGRVVRLTYDSNGRLTRYDWPLAAGTPTTAFAYEDGRTVVTDPRGNATTYRFDPVGRATGVIDALGNSTATDYTSHSNVRTHRSRRGGTTSFTYANQTSVESATAPTGMGTEALYEDPRHPYLPTRTMDPQRNRTWFEYDEAGNVIEQRNWLPDENTVNLRLRPDGQRAQVTNPRGAQTSYDYDGLGHVVAIHPPQPLDTVVLSYDVLSRLTEVTDGNGLTTAYQYDALDRLRRVTHDDGSEVTFVYDADGNQTRMTDASGTTFMSYDAHNLLVERSTPDGLLVTYAYDAAGNLTSVTDRGGTVTYVYNEVNLPVQVIDRDGQTITMSYDASYNRTAIGYPNGVTVSRVFDASDRLVEIEVDQANQGLALAYDYWEPTTGSRDTALRWASTWIDGLTTDYRYDQINRLTRARTIGSDGQVAVQHAYEYDGASNRLSRSVFADGTTTTETSSYNLADQLTDHEGETFTYDGAGNLTGSSAGAVFDYNAAGQTTRLRSRTAPDLEARMTYRGLGQTERVEMETQQDPPECTILNPLPCLEPDPLPVTMHLDHTTVGVTRIEVDGTTFDYTRGPDGLLLASHSPDGAHYFLHDGLGSTLGLVDADADLAALYRYGPFGETTVEQGVELFNPWRYTGAFLDPTGLYHIGERYYDPDLGRWTQQDPYLDVLDPKQWNRYVYVGNDPINHTDPTGMFSETAACVGRKLASAVWPLNRADRNAAAVLAGGVTFSAGAKAYAGVVAFALTPLAGLAMTKAAALTAGIAIGGTIMGASLVVMGVVGYRLYRGCQV